MYVYRQVCRCMLMFHDAIHVKGHVGEMEISRFVVNFIEPFA